MGARDPIAQLFLAAALLAAAACRASPDHAGGSKAQSGSCALVLAPGDRWPTYGLAYEVKRRNGEDAGAVAGRGLLQAPITIDGLACESGGAPAEYVIVINGAPMATVAFRKAGERQQVVCVPPLGAGDLAPDIVFRDLHGRANGCSFAQLRGKTVVAVFWASWCGPCKRFIEKMRVGLDQEEYRDVEFVLVNLDSETSAALQAAGSARLSEVENSWQWPGPDKPWRELGIGGLPATMVIGKDGLIVLKASPSLQPDSILQALGRELKRSRQ